MAPKGTTTTIDALAGLVGQHLGTSDWFHIDQARINAFADATDDHQWIHVDPERAAATAFRGTIAHGYLTLSLLAPLLVEVLTVTPPPCSSTSSLTSARPMPAPPCLRPADSTRRKRSKM